MNSEHSGRFRKIEVVPTSSLNCHATDSPSSKIMSTTQKTTTRERSTGEYELEDYQIESLETLAESDNPAAELAQDVLRIIE